MANIKPQHHEIDTTRMTPKEFAKTLDHSFLKTFFTNRDLDIFCDDLKNYCIKYCSVSSITVPDAVKRVKGTDIQVGAAIGFPMGRFCPEIKAAELELAIRQGAAFYDMIGDIPAIKERDWDRFLRDMGIVQKVAIKHEVPGKVIIETCYLTDEEMVKAAQLAVEAGMDYVKTSSGFAPGTYKRAIQDTNIYEIRLLKDTVGPDVGIKASSGCNCYDTALAYFKAGATRIGTDIAPQLVAECALRYKHENSQFVRDV